MELDQMDKAYARNKKALDKSGKLMMTLDTLKKDVKSLTRQIENIQIEIIRAKEDGDTSKVKSLQSSLKARQQQLEAKKTQLEKLAATAQKSQATIDQKIAELSQDPALKAHLEEVIGKKFSRQLTKISKSKDEKVKQNETLTKIHEAAKKEPNVMYLLKAIENCISQINFAKKTIADPSQSASDIATAKNVLKNLEDFLEQSRSELAAYFKGTISRDVINKITSYEDLGREIKSNEKQIKGFDKQMANYETALGNIGFASPLKEAQSSDRSDDSSSTTRTASRTTSSTTRREPSDLSNNLPATNPKWYQFAARFRNWRARRKANASKDTQEPVIVSDEEKSKFKNSMKYEVVRDYEEQLAVDLLKQAKAQNRQTTDREIDD